MVLSKLKKLRFSNWIDYNLRILGAIPPKVLEMVEAPFSRAARDGFDFYKPAV